MPPALYHDTRTQCHDFFLGVLTKTKTLLLPNSSTTYSPIIFTIFVNQVSANSSQHSLRHSLASSSPQTSSSPCIQVPCWVEQAPSSQVLPSSDLGTLLPHRVSSRSGWALS